ncbi:MAG: hypothetical protein VYE73_00470 [Acidobacteriota bacterium]|nr:hypothetical protein [Acidobacteriota bacterium]
MVVWDPEQDGRVESGLEFFGSVAFWLFFDNGYQALSTLDDDADT